MKVMFLEKQKRSVTYKSELQLRIPYRTQDQYTARPVCALVACDSGFMHFCLLLWEQHNGIDLHSVNSAKPKRGFELLAASYLCNGKNRRDRNQPTVSRCDGNGKRVTCCCLLRSSREVGNNAGFDVCLTTAVSNSGASKKSLASMPGMSTSNGTGGNIQNST